MCTAKSHLILDSADAVHQVLRGATMGSAWLPSSTIKDVTPVKGGSTNYTFRLHFHKPFEVADVAQGPSSLHTSAIFKYFPDHIFLTPDISFSSHRQVFEARALTEIPNYLKPSHRNHVQICLPKLYYADSEAHFIIIEDLSPKYDLEHLNDKSSINFAQLIRQVSKDPFLTQVTVQVGTSLGAWLYELHTLGRNQQSRLRDRFDNADSRKIIDLTTLGDFIRCIELCGTQLETERKQRIHTILAQHGDEILEASDASTLVMGDFWMGNFMIRLKENPENQDREHLLSESKTGSCEEYKDASASSANVPESRVLVHIIDWEFVTYTLPYVDLAHFAAQAWLFDYFRRESEGAGRIARTVTAGFFDAYSQAGGAIDLQKIIVYIAGHIGCFLHYTNHWTNDEISRTAACLQAVAMIEHADARHWEELSKDGFLKSLFPHELTN